MSHIPDVLLLDDGELLEIQALLESVGILPALVRGVAACADTPHPRRLLVATPRRLTRLAEVETEQGEPGAVVLVCDEAHGDAIPDRTDAQWDFLVRRPVHPEALRLLLFHILYTGEERRAEPRVPVGIEASFENKLLARRATLVDLSTGGCRLLSPQRVDTGNRIAVEIPRAENLGEPLRLTGRVTRVERHPGGKTDRYAIGVHFEKLNPELRGEIEWLLEEWRQGPAKVEADLAERPSPQPTPSTPHYATQRETPRGLYDRRVPTFGRESRVLVGRDLSVGGIRVEALPGLELGESMQVAIYGAAREEPVLVEAEVARDDGEHGVVLRFGALDAERRERLEKVIATLPALESRGDPSEGGRFVLRVVENQNT